jgi:hypothetical protein
LKPSCSRIGRLAVDRRHQGRQLGAALLFDAIARVIRADAAVFALVVDAKDEAAARFYRHYGFEAFSGRAAVSAGGDGEEGGGGVSGSGQQAVTEARRRTLQIIKLFQLVDGLVRGGLLDETCAKAHRGEMRLTRIITVFLLTLGLTLGSAVSISLATEQAFATPCPMEQKGDCPCKDHCDSAVMNCAAKCPAPLGEAVLLKYAQLYSLSGALSFGIDSYLGSQFKGGPPAPIPIV